MEITTAEQNKENTMRRIENSLRDLWDNIKCTKKKKKMHQHLNYRLPEEEEKKKETEKIFEEIMSENFPNMVK